MCPTTENQVAVFTSEGRILFWNIEFDLVGIYSKQITEELDSIPTLLTARPVGSIGSKELSILSSNHEQGLTLGDTISPHWFTPSEGKYIYLHLPIYYYW